MLLFPAELKDEKLIASMNYKGEVYKKTILVLGHILDKN